MHTHLVYAILRPEVDNVSASEWRLHRLPVIERPDGPNEPNQLQISGLEKPVSLKIMGKEHDIFYHASVRVIPCLYYRAVGAATRLARQRPTWRYSALFRRKFYRKNSTFPFCNLIVQTLW